MPSLCLSQSSLSQNLQYSLLINSKTVDDIVYEVDCSMITVKAGADVDIGTRLATITAFILF